MDEEEKEREERKIKLLEEQVELLKQVNAKKIDPLDFYYPPDETKCDKVVSTIIGITATIVVIFLFVLLVIVVH